MATVVVTTQAKPLGYPSQSMIDRNPGNGGTPGPGNPDVGSLFCVIKNTAGNFETFRSNDGGVSWATFGTPLVRANIVEWSGIYLDDNHYMHWVYRTNESSQDRIYYRKQPITGGGSGVWDAEFLVQADGNGGVAGAVWTGLDLAVRHHSTGTYIVIIAAGKTVGATNGVVLMGVSLDFTAGTYLNNQQIRTNRTWLATGSGRITPSIDFEHTGDARTSSTPHLWLAWGRNEARMVKLSWAGTLSGWNGPTGSIVLDSTLGVSQDSMAARWDGERFLIAYPKPGNLDMVKVVERNRANTGQVVRQTPAHTQGNIRNIGIDWASNGDHRIWAVGTSTPDLYHVDFVRATGLYGSWTLFSATDIIGSPPNQWSVRRGTYGNSRYDVLTAHATPSPNTVLHTQQALAFSPTTPTWLSPANNAAGDVAVSLVLDWTFNDPDATDTQGSYALSRQVGAAALEYWRASDSTWQVAEVQNTGATTGLTLTATQWSLDGTANGATDPNHTYKVKTWDATGLPSVYSAGLVLVPSAKVNPTIVTPTAAQVLTTSSVTFTWTVAEETAYRWRLATNPGGVVVYDSGFITGTELTFTPPYVLADNTGWTATLETKNLEGLISTAVTRSFTVDYIEPMVPTLVVTPSTVNGYMAVAITNPAPSGGAPALSYQDLYRRPVGLTTETLVATGLASGATYNDWRCPGRLAVEYRARAVGVNGTSVYSAWTA